ncbi:hypothetical protein [Thermocatellispora tengchongensis]|uniref:hypothetical protein n=1 Tax=Thermocatellispora tengchongensis TaxID=1073253 RepID=UPI00363BB1A4
MNTASADWYTPSFRLSSGTWTVSGRGDGTTVTCATPYALGSLLLVARIATVRSVVTAGAW